MDFKDYFILIFFVLAFVLFFWGIYSAIYWSNKGDPTKMPRFLRQVVTGCGGVLAANLGAVLGIKIEQALVQNINLIENLYAIPADTTLILQMIAMVLYVVGMIIVFIAWGRLKFTEDPERVVITLPQLTQTLFGICIGALAIVLAV